MYLTLLMLAIFLSCMALMGSGGIWNNLLTLVNVIFAALIATNYFEPLANYLQTLEPSYTFFWDFLALWALFALSMMILRTLTDTLSKVKVRFKKPFDIGGGLFFSAWTAWILICFTMTTLHTAPLARNFMFGEFQPTPKSKNFLGLGPDWKWLGLMHRVSVGPFCKYKVNPFDPQAEFILKYGERRARFEAIVDSRVRN